MTRRHAPLSCLASAILALFLAAGTAGAQPGNVEPGAQWAWGENIGWTAWAAAGDDQGVHVGSSHLSGWVWAENAGWIHLGDGTPAAGSTYANVDGSDFGVNVDLGTRRLSGFGWGENIGWVQFDTATLGEDAARFDPVTRRLVGYAWGENVGWIRLGEPSAGETGDGDDEVAGPPPALIVVGPAVDLGSGKPAADGSSPALAAWGATGSGEAWSLGLVDAPRHAPTVWYVGSVAMPQPFLGGTLVPLPDLGVVAMTASNDGTLAWSLRGGSGGGPTTVVVQVAVAVGPDVALSNALEIVVEP